MTSLANDQLPGAPADAARRFLDALAVQDFEELAATLSDDVRLRAVLPGATKEWHGVDRVKTTFVRWFGDTQEFELIETAVDGRGTRVHLSWHARVRAERLGEGWFRVEQQSYVETDDDNRIQHIWLACSGYLPERPAQ